jgi:predicted tellurium resistance membrane protein TerC
MLMDKYPILVYIGAAVLGRVAGEMMITDPFVDKVFHPSKIIQYSVQAFFTLSVLVAGKLWIKWKRSREGQFPESASPGETLNSLKED